MFADERLPIPLSLGYYPRPWQESAHLRMERFTVLAVHRRGGKTEVALMQLIDKALEFTEELGLFLYVAPLLKQAKIIAWARLKRILQPFLIAGIIEINETDLSVTIKQNGAVIRVYGADNPDGMRGIRIDGVVIDEVAQIKPEVWESIIQPALADRLGWALFIGTPDGVNLFSELFFKASGQADWYAARWTVYDTGALRSEEIARLKATMSETAFAREMLCDFSAAGADQLISVALIEEASQRVYVARDVDYAPRILGVDPARFGDDRSGIIKRQGLQCFDPIFYRGIDNMQLAGHVSRIIDSWMPDAVFVDSGAGSGVIDRLRQLHYEIIEVNFGGRPDDLKYLNKRSEMWFGIVEWLKAGGALPKDVDMKMDLAGPTYWYDAQNRKVLEPKDDMKARGLKSPDLGDGLALTFAHPVEKKDPVREAVGLVSKRREHNPLENILV